MQRQTIRSAEELLAEKGIILKKEKLGTTNYDMMVNLLIENIDLFANSMADLKRTSIISHSIDTGDARPICKRPYPQTPENRTEIARQVTELLDLGIVTTSNSPWSAPTVLVSKHDGSKRLCIDYRGLNSLTINRQGSYLSSFEDVSLALAEAQPNIFSTLDLRSGYYVIPLKEEDCKKTAFDVPSIGRI